MLRTSTLRISVAALLLGTFMTAWAGPMQEWFQRRGRFGQRHRGAQMGQQFDRGNQNQGRNEPITLPSGARLVSDVAYGSDPAQVLDVYIPHGASNAPIIFMVHGGGWQRGDKAAHNVVQNKIDYFLPQGFIFVSIDYRMVPEVPVTTEVQDVAHALAYVQQHASTWGGDASRLVVMGHSAGSQLVALMTAAPSIWQDAGAKSWRGTIALDSAALNIVQIMDAQHFRLYDRVFGNSPELWQEMSPTLRLQRAPQMPMLMVCSSLRSNSCDQAHEFANKVKSLGGKAEVFPVALGHPQINANVGRPGPLTDKVESFIDSLHMK